MEIFWIFILTVLIFGVLIAVHELGHFLAARLFKVKVNEFAIGMGPKLFAHKSKKSGTLYTIRLFPIGGYNSIEGEDGDSQEAGAFCSKPVWQRMIIILAGGIMNLLTGIIIMAVLVLGSKQYVSNQIDVFFMKDENGNYKFEGRFNQGVVSLNLPQIGILAKGDEENFWKLLDERLQLCFEALMCRHNALKSVRSDSSPIHWQYGAIARLPKGAPIAPLLYGGYSSISLGYIGLYEVTKLMKGCSHTQPEGQEFARKVMNRLRSACDQWKRETNIGFALYGTPAESLCYRFARIDKERFGTIPDVTDKGYYTNSYHVDVREHIDAFQKFTFESQFQKISTGGCISYVEIPNMRHNLEALKEVVRYIYDNIQYAEFNTKSDYCQVCGYDGEITINDDFQWECPVCHNKDQAKMNVTRRTCGYLGENYWNVGKTKEIKARVLHL